MLKRIFLFISLFALLNAEPKAIVFDFGGVMTGKPDKEAVVAFLKETFKLTDQEFEIANREKHKAIQKGMTDLQFWLEYAELRQIKLPENWSCHFYETMKMALGINYQMFALVAELKNKGYSVILLSNIDERLGKLIKELGFYEPFDICMLSYEIGYEKPDLRIYSYLIEKLELKPSDIVFIDDRQENVDSAKLLGIDAILFVSYEILRCELNNRAF